MIKNYRLFLMLILLFAVLLRFYNFSWRWGLGGDDARDAAIAQEAILRRELPLTGSFSSAGPFVFGPIFYWLVMFSYLLLLFTLLAPWLVSGVIGVLAVLIFSYAGKLIGGRKLSLLVGFLAAVSPQLIVRSLMLG